MVKESYQVKFEKDKKSKMIYAFVIDFIGYLSYVIPGVTEMIDIFWAPVAAVFVFILFRFKPKLALLGALGILVEEFVPFIDFIPTTLLLWTLIYVKDMKDTLELYRQIEENDLEIVDDE